MGQVLKRAFTGEATNDEDNTNANQQFSSAISPTSAVVHSDVMKDDEEEAASSSSESESEQLDKMYGFAKSVDGRIKKPMASEDSNPLKRKFSSIGEVEEARFGHDPAWLSKIRLNSDTELIQLGFISSHVANVLVIKANNDFTTGKRIWEEQQKLTETTPVSISTKFAAPPTNPVVITPSQEAMNELVSKRLVQKQRHRMKGWNKNAEMAREEEEWSRLMLLRIGDGTVVFNEHRQPVGKICDVFGPIYDPYYTIRFPDQTTLVESLLNQRPYPSELPKKKQEEQEDSNNKKKTEEKLEDEARSFVGLPLYFAIQHSTIMNVTNVIDSTIQGSDATNEKQQEPNADEVEYSDDEDERRAKKRRLSVSEPATEFFAKSSTRGARGGARGARGGRGRGRGRGGYHVVEDPFERSDPDYSSFAAKFNAQLQQPTPDSFQSAPPSPQRVLEDNDIYIPSSPTYIADPQESYVPSSPVYTPSLPEPPTNDIQLQQPSQQSSATDATNEMQQ